MKVIHVPFTFYPEPVGGTEVYVESLAKAQQHLGIRPIVAAPGTRKEQYCHGSIPVWRFPVGEVIGNVSEMYGQGDTVAADAFAQILEIEQPDLVHVHAFTRAISLRLVRQVKRKGLPVLFSYHTPTVTCQRGTLLKKGRDVCDGILDVRKCARCTLHGLGMNSVLSVCVGSLPQSLGRLADSAGLSGGAWTAMRMTELVGMRHQATKTLISEVDHIVALCQWVKALLLANKVLPEKVTVLRQGLCQESFQSCSSLGSPKASEGVKMVFLGRLDPTKGVHILLEALKAFPDLPIFLDIYGIVQGEGGLSYLRRLREIAGNDQRISFHNPVPTTEVVNRIRRYDVLAVPSQFLETGPMVVLEAFAAGVPVVGSNIGGIAESVRDGIDGLLTPMDCVTSWSAVLRRIVVDPSLLPALRAGIRPPRKMSDIALSMNGLYARLTRPSQNCGRQQAVETVLPS